MLTARQRLLAAVVDSLGGLKLNRFPDRLLLQKRMFLLTMSGVDLGYPFSWYLRGPYSASLTKDAFGINEERRKGTFEPSSLPVALRTQLDVVRHGLSSTWDDPEKIELAASVLFLSKSGPVDEEAIWKRLAELKPYKEYAIADVRSAVALLRSRGFWR